MKQSDIKLWHEYVNKKYDSGYKCRKVMNITLDELCCKYVVFMNIYRSNDYSEYRSYHEYKILLKSFARWAKEDVT